MSMEIVRVPDIGSEDAVDVIEVSVKVGDQLEQEATIVVLESDKATVEVPLPMAGTVKRILVKTGDRVKQGDSLLELEVIGSDAKAAAEIAAPATADEEAPQERESAEHPVPATPTTTKSKPKTTAPAVDARIELRVPDLGDIDTAEVIEVLVKEGDVVEIDQTLAVLESDKASMEIPANAAGTLIKLSIKVGDKLKTGDLIGALTSLAGSKPDDADTPTQTPSDKARREHAEPVTASSPVAAKRENTEEHGEQSDVVDAAAATSVYAGPAVRKLARELGVDLVAVTGSGPRQRILQEDVHAWVKQQLARSGSSAVSVGAGLPALPEIDFSRFGPVEHIALNKLRKVAASNLHRSWLTIPHVTQHDDADITELEAFRQAENGRLAKDGVKLTMLAFLVRACAIALEKFPRFNSSMSVEGDTLIEKRYIHIGVAVETENGLMVPVLRDANKKGIIQIAAEVAELAAKARNRKLTPTDMQGGTFSISSLGGIGGTAFTPIVNWPEVAILGVSKSDMKPRWNGHEFEPRLMLPLSLSYDHRVIDGADAARFITYLNQLLTDLRRALL
jgi:pyruvate dehydrogenase E2 component (dihydrolipoamide acetyltransferase)